MLMHETKSLTSNIDVLGYLRFNILTIIQLLVFYSLTMTYLFAISNDNDTYSFLIKSNENFTREKNIYCEIQTLEPATL